jgi:hypothetical protein
LGFITAACDYPRGIEKVKRVFADVDVTVSVPPRALAI